MDATQHGPVAVPELTALTPHPPVSGAVCVVPTTAEISIIAGQSATMTVTVLAPADGAPLPRPPSCLRHWEPHTAAVFSQVGATFSLRFCRAVGSVRRGAKWEKMHKAVLKIVFPAVITVLLAALLITSQATIAQAITNTPSCTTDPTTGNTDCGGSDFFWLAGIGLASGVLFCLIYAYRKSGRG